MGGRGGERASVGPEHRVSVWEDEKVLETLVGVAVRQCDDVLDATKLYHENGYMVNLKLRIF